MLLLLGLLLGPGPTDEGILYEDEPQPVVQTEPSVPAPETATAPTPETVPAPPPVFEPEPEHEPAPKTAPAPVFEPELEPATATEPALEPARPPQPRLALPPPPPPPSGSGRLVGGSFAIALGLGAATAVIVEATRENGSPQFAAATFVPLGLTSIGVGTYLLVRGAKARANYDQWRAFSERDALPSGEGLIVAGVMSTLIGGVTLVAAAVQARDPDALERPLTPSLFAVAGTGVTVGVGALTWGLLRRSKYLSWRQSTFLAGFIPSVTPLLDPDLGLRGASFAVAARF